MKRAALAAVGGLAFLGCMVSSAKAGDESYRDEVEHWRQKREADLKADDGWLSVSGLFWLTPGETKVGSDPANDVMLPARAPALLGTLTLNQGQAVFQVAPGVTITRNGMAFESGPIHSDADEHPDTLAVGDLKLILLKRGQKFALRLKDKQNPLRTSFAGLRWYPVREEWRVQGRFVAYPAPTQMVLDTIVGEAELTESPGYVSFERDGTEFRLQAISQKNGTLWFVFRDGTSGRTTHSGARQLYADAPRGGVVTLDFNKATNLPCAYIPYATCPLAPRQNRLGMAVEAGELKYEAGRSDASPVASGRSS
jgi:uncharacterized protein (DUF1684 family)